MRIAQELSASLRGKDSAVPRAFVRLDPARARRQPGEADSEALALALSRQWL